MNKEKNLTTIKSYLYGLVSMIILLIADQFTKYLAITHLKNSEDIILINKVLRLHYLENKGAAFGMFQNKQIVFAVVAVAVVIFVAYMYKKIPHTNRYFLLRFTAVLVVSGAVGNVIDRLFHNYVVDFIYFELIDFPVFNVADIYVVVACILFAIGILFYYKDEELEVFSLKKGNK